MFLSFLKFELNYWLRRPMLYIFIGIAAFFIALAVHFDEVTIGQSMTNLHKDAPHAVVMYFAFISIILLLCITAFMNGAAARDFTYNSHQLIFSKPISKGAYLFGRFTGAVLIASLIGFGVTLGVLIGQIGLPAERLSGFYGEAHLKGYLFFTLPNTFFIGSIIFCIAALTRSTIASFIGTLLLLVAYGVAGSFVRDLDNEQIAMLTDPFGIRSYSILTKYWTVEDRNTMTISMGGMFLLNRLIWCGVGLVFLGITYWKFSFSEKNKQGKSLEKEENNQNSNVLKVLPLVSPMFSGSIVWQQLWNQTKVDFLGVTKSTVFIVILAAGLLNMLPALLNSNESYGLTMHPVAYNVAESIRGTLYLFLIAIITFFAGTLVYKERDAKMSEIFDAFPHANWISYVSKFLAMSAIVAIIMTMAMATGLAVQSYLGYDKFEPMVYAKILGLDYLGMVLMIALAMFIHTLCNNKYIGFFVFIAFILGNSMLWGLLEVSSNMVRFGGVPSFIYSDMNQLASYVKGQFWFNLYWVLFIGLMAIATILFWMRGREESFRFRWANAKQNFQGNLRWATLGLGVLWSLTAGFVYYNTKVVNKITTSKDGFRIQADYERKYKQYEGRAQPRITDVKYNIQLFPAERKAMIDAKQIIKNKTTQAIDSLHISLPYRDGAVFDLRVEHGTLLHEDKRNAYLIYKFSPALAPGDSLHLDYTTTYTAKGFENEVSFTKVVENGTFFNNADVAPEIGYQPNGELMDKEERKKQSLPERKRAPTLDCVDKSKHTDTYLSNNSDWVNVETIISTSADQIAIAPGSLLKEWKADGRNFYHYKLDHFAWNFYSFISARYEVTRDKWNDIDIEVYSHKGHYNVEKMINSVKKSLEYYTKNFGPYYHKQCRIVEFPRYQQFAQAFPGTMPYSEGIGFIARIEKEEDIDMVFYVVAHEMGHQWWAHQVCSPNMQGAVLTSETFAQYSALMVMQKEYGVNTMRKFLKYEMDNYLRSRAREREGENPLKTVENQDYVYYRKGSVVMFYLKEMIGEEAVNASMRELLARYRYKDAPYPTSCEMLDIFKQHTPDTLQYLIKDLFEDIILFGNRTLEAKSTQLSDGTWQTTVEVECKKFSADAKGKETEVAINDWVEIGALTAPKDGKKEGEVLHRQRVKINTTNNTFSFITKDKPYKAGIDPLCLLIDRMPLDNLKKVE